MFLLHYSRCLGKENEKLTIEQHISLHIWFCHYYLVLFIQTLSFKTEVKSAEYAIFILFLDILFYSKHQVHRGDA